jgi:SPASM domain peptide maturase of grasp-with-spasm system
MKENKLWFKLFSNCVIVKGEKESLIYDLGRNTNYPIPNFLIEVLKKLQSLPLSEYKKETKNETDVEVFVRQFVDEEIAFLTTTPELFPNLNLVWESPHSITNAILEIKKNSKFKISNVFKQLEEIGCQAIQLRIKFTIKLETITRYLAFLNNTRINCIDLLIPFDPKITLEELNNLIVKFPRIRAIILFSSKKNLVVSHDDILLNRRIIYLKKSLFKNNNEVINKNNFLYNIPAFTESLVYNLGLNRKVCITSEGLIKNYLNHTAVFGNVERDLIKSVINQPEFQYKWNISNDKIERCKDCQFRFSCESNSDIYSKNNKFYKKDYCSFDPHNNKWT